MAKRMPTFYGSLPLLVGSIIVLSFLFALAWRGCHSLDFLGWVNSGCSQCSKLNGWAAALLAMPVWTAILGCFLARGIGLQHWLVRALFLLSTSFTGLLIVSTPSVTVRPELKEYAKKPYVPGEVASEMSVIPSFPTLAKKFLLEEHKKAAAQSKVQPELKEYARNPQASGKTPSEELLLAEHEKAVAQIAGNIEHEDAWFRYKFVLIGGLLLAFLTKLRQGDDGPTLGGRDAPHQESPEVRMTKLLTSSATCFVLALSCVVAIAIDIHLRSNVNVSTQIGLWITYYAEPAFLQVPFPNSQCPNAERNNAETSNAEKNYAEKKKNFFYPWEQFLRIPPEDKILPQDEVGSTMHLSELYSLSFWPHLHFLTWVIYIVYLVVLQNASLESTPPTRWLLIGGFVLVQVSFGVFAFVGHSAPEAFILRPIPFLNGWLFGWAPPLIYVFLSLFLASTNLPYLAAHPRANIHPRTQ